PPAETDLFEGTWIATFSADGQYLLQAVGLDSGARDFWVTHLETGASTEVAADLESAVPVAFALGPVWETDGTVFVAWNVIGAYFFPIDGAGLATTASPVTEQSTQASTVFAPGDTALTTGMTPIFAAPDANATVVHILAPNNTVQILGEPVTNEQGTWYPVL